jgi:cytochrome P450
MKAARVDVNFFDPRVIADPYPEYEKIRAEGRLVWNDLLGGWMVPGYDDCVEVLMDPGRFAIRNGEREVVSHMQGLNMIQVDGAEHERLRRCLTPLFTRSAIAKWEGRVGEVVDELLAPLAQGRTDYDLIADFTMIPTVIVAEMMGVPKERHEDFRRWSHDISSNLAYGHENPGAHDAMMQASHELNEYLGEEIARHRRESSEDLISIMLEMKDMTDEEIQSTAHLLLVAGYDTTAKLMGTSLVALERNPDQRRLVADEPVYVAQAVEEVLRWAGVSHMIPRRAVKDTTLADQDIEAGALVYVLGAAANRDPARWNEPDRFDVRRAQKANLGFGFGPHLCLGAPLARLETKVTVERLLRMAPDYELRDIDFGTGFSCAARNRASWMWASRSCSSIRGGTGVNHRHSR